MIDILFCGNDGVFDGMLTCALSILKRTDTREPFRFHIFTMDVSHLDERYTCIPREHIRLLEDTVKRYNRENAVKVYDVTKYYMKAFSGCPNEGAYCSPYTLIRLFADVVKGIPDKLLYLDADIMFNRDVRLLWDTDVDGYEYAAARDHYGKYLIGPNYINAGVLLFNMRLARQTGLFRKARLWIKRKKLVFADQSALIRSTTRKKMLPQRFNDQKFLHKHTVVRHFSKRLFWLPYPHTDNIKQWHIDKVHSVFKYRQFDDIFEEYLRIINPPVKEQI
ncbi:Lipopolysaccharide biosynthesis protein, LPS:glycosyltransferase [Ruminococcaceae bacterium FB2012]|nr:Lipopolysaccharide biosynthesis protein, LPS:glycosyltransferase [Ruminococcaceae bacterium FB2012]